MIDEPLTEHNFIVYCMKNYDNPNCTSVKEFHDDLKHTRYIKKQLKKYYKTGELKERLILNHIITLNNVFSLATPRILFYKLDKQLYSAIKTFLVFLNLMPETLIADEMIYSSDIPIDDKIAQCLRKI